MASLITAIHHHSLYHLHIQGVNGLLLFEDADLGLLWSICNIKDITVATKKWTSHTPKAFSKHKSPTSCQNVLCAGTVHSSGIPHISYTSLGSFPSPALASGVGLHCLSNPL